MMVTCSLRSASLVVAIGLLCVVVCNIKLCHGYGGTTQKSRKSVCSGNKLGNINDVKQYVMAEQYGAALCHLDNTFRCYKPKDSSHRWTIHGLWPTGNSKGEPKCCQTYDGTSVQDLPKDLLRKLKKDWPNLKKKSICPTCLWEHEWQKHGTCYPGSAQNGKSLMYGYFDNTLTLFENSLNFDKILSQAGIVPRPQPYTVNQLLSVFNGSVSELICVRKSTAQYSSGCRRPRKSSTIGSHLKEIRICLHKDTFDPATCIGGGVPDYHTCGTDDSNHVKVFYLSYTS